MDLKQWPHQSGSCRPGVAYLDIGGQVSVGQVFLTLKLVVTTLARRFLTSVLADGGDDQVPVDQAPVDQVFHN